MKPDLNRSFLRRSQRGTAAIEVALVVLVLFSLLVGAFVIGRLIWQYNVVKTATMNSGRYMAAAPWDATRQATAIQLVLDAAADVGASDVTAQVSCLPLQYTCSDSHSTTIVVTANASVSDPTHFLIGDGMGVAAASAVRHAH
jgi:Flp pilus assembly protein TadG